jgi:hypothetical protein
VSVLKGPSVRRQALRRHTQILPAAQKGGVINDFIAGEDFSIFNETVLALLEAVPELRGDPDLSATNSRWSNKGFNLAFSTEGDDFDFARQQLEVVKTAPLSIAILIGHALKSFGLDQYGFVLCSWICFHFRKLALLVHALSVTLKARLGWPYFAIC